MRSGHQVKDCKYPASNFWVAGVSLTMPLAKTVGATNISAHCRPVRLLVARMANIFAICAAAHQRELGNTLRELIADMSDPDGIHKTLDAM